MSDNRLFGPRGELYDFEPRQGDIPPNKGGPAPGQQRPHGSRRRWGNRVLMSLDKTRFPRSRDSVTFVDTGDLSRAYPINVQMRFASVVPGTTGAPAGLFTPIAPLGEALTINVRRGLDPDGTTGVDVYNIGPPSPDRDVLPFDITTARSLGVDVTLTASAAGAVWVEAIATVVDAISDQNTVTGWPVPFQANFPASAANVQFLSRHADRQQFIIVNLSTDADLYVKFGLIALTGGLNSASVVLPRGGFSSYESPVGGFRGVVGGQWSAAPTGSALVTEGTFF